MYQCNAARYTNIFKLKCIYLKQTPTVHTYLFKAKCAPQRGRNWRTFPFEEVMYGKTPLAFEPNLQTSKAMARR